MGGFYGGELSHPLSATAMVMSSTMYYSSNSVSNRSIVTREVMSFYSDWAKITEGVCGHALNGSEPVGNSVNLVLVRLDNHERVILIQEQL